MRKLSQRNCGPGVFRRELGDGEHAEIVMDERVRIASMAVTHRVGAPTEPVILS